MYASLSYRIQCCPYNDPNTMNIGAPSCGSKMYSADLFGDPNKISRDPPVGPGPRVWECPIRSTRYLLISLRNHKKGYRWPVGDCLLLF